MSYPGPGAIHRQCIMCGLPFRVWEYELRQSNRAKFCSIGCYSESRRIFSAALSDGRLAILLADDLKAAIQARAARKPDDFMARKLAAGKGRRVLSNTSASVRDMKGAQKTVS
jgi:hypothetical protein